MRKKWLNVRKKRTLDLISKQELLFEKRKSVGKVSKTPSSDEFWIVLMM